MSAPRAESPAKAAAHFTGRFFNFLGDQADILSSSITGGIGAEITTPEGKVTLDVFYSDTMKRNVVELAITPTGGRTRRTSHAIHITDAAREIVPVSAF